MDSGPIQANAVSPLANGRETAALSPQVASRLSQLYSEHVDSLKRYIAARFGPGPPEPEDIAQAAFAQMASGDIDSVNDPRAFLYSVACNLVIDHHRRNIRREAVHQDLLVHSEQDGLSAFSPEHVLLAKEQFAVFEMALNEMPAMRRRIFLMVRTEGEPPAEIARRFDITENAVHQHVSRALADCAAAFQRAERKGLKL